MDSIKSFFGYFLDKTPGTEFSYYIPMVILICGLFIGTIIFRHAYKKRKNEDLAFRKLFKNVGKTMSLFGILLTIILIVRFENIPYFSMRIWLYISMGILGYFAYRYVKLFKKTYPKMKSCMKIKTVTKKEERYTTRKKRK